jgi:hypothetical protein
VAWQKVSKLPCQYRMQRGRPVHSPDKPAALSFSTPMLAALASTADQAVALLRSEAHPRYATMTVEPTGATSVFEAGALPNVPASFVE